MSYKRGNVEKDQNIHSRHQNLSYMLPAVYGNTRKFDLPFKGWVLYMCLFFEKLVLGD